MNPLIQSYLTECQQLRAPKTYRDYLARLTRFDQFAGITSLDRTVVVNYLLHLKESGAGPASISLHEATVRAFFTWLVHNGQMATNPLLGRPIMPYASPTRSDDFAITSKEYEAIKAFCLNQDRFHEWYGASIVGWNTGLRLADVVRLGAEHINRDALLIEPQKTRRMHKHIKMPISKELQTWLDTFEHLPVRFFPELFRRYQTNDALLSQQFGRICFACYVTGKSFHSYRHAFLARHLNAGIPLSIISSMTGQTMKVIQRYSHVTLEDQKKALERMVA